MHTHLHAGEEVVRDPVDEDTRGVLQTDEKRNHGKADDALDAKLHLIVHRIHNTSAPTKVTCSAAVA